MIQRIQSVYILLAIVLLIVFIISPAAANDHIIYLPKENIITLILTYITGAIMLLNIFLFKNRKRQIAICRISILTIIVMLVLTFTEMEKTVPGYTLLLSIYALPAAIVFLFLAARAIGRDEKVVRDMDRLR